MAENKADETACGNDEDTGSGNQRALQLLWSERKLPFDTKLLEISEIQHIPNAEQKRPERKVQVRKVSESVELLCIRTSFNDRYMGLVSNDCLKSCMRENCTYGSVRGSRQAFHLKYFERSVEIVYSTNQK